MPSFTKFQKVFFGITAVGGASLYCLNDYTKKRQVFASWTTNYIPSVKWDDNWDHRHPTIQVNPKKLVHEKEKNQVETFENSKPKATRHLILVRHGQYNLDGRNDDERILTDIGRQQVDWTGRRLKELGFPYTDMVKSTMSRAQETGTIISQFLPEVPVRECHLIREGAPVPPEPPVGHWKPETFFYQDGARIEAAFRNYFHRADPQQDKDTYTLLVCHANVIRYFVCRALQFPPEAWLRLSLNHASITWISITPSGRVILRTLGESGHIPPNLLTSR